MDTQTLWLFGLSGSGKTTLCEKFKNKHVDWIWLDGDTIRKGLNNDLSFSYEDRTENIRRTCELCKLLNEQGFNVIVSLITPLETQRELIKSKLGNNCKLIYLDCNLITCEKRDIKGLYKKARDNKIENFTGVSSDFEIPIYYYSKIDTKNSTINESFIELLRLEGTYESQKCNYII